MDPIRQTTLPTVSNRTASPAPRGPEQASDELHLISHIDATEPIIEPHATADLQHFEEVKQVSGDRFTGEMMIDRLVMAPKKKVLQGAANLAVMLAPLATGLAVGFSSGSLLVGAACTLVGWQATKMLARHGFLQKGLGPIASAVYEKNMAEPMWTGRRTYQLAADQTHAVDSPALTQEALPSVRNPDDITKFFVDSMKKHPSGTTVVHMVGHGLGYRYSAGLPFRAFESVLRDTTTQAGRAVDVVLLESCLVGNLESLAATYPYARYTVCSEETISAHTVGAMMKRTAEATQGEPLTPRAYASALVDNAQPKAAATQPPAPGIRGMIEAASAQQGPETLIVVDNEKMPALVDAVDRLGVLLAAEVGDGRTEGIAAAVSGTPQYPKGAMSKSMRNKLTIGDLKAFTDRLGKVYRGEAVETPARSIGPLHRSRVEQFAAAQQSPRAGDILQAARAVQASMEEAIVNRHTSASYSDSGGMSIQLPGRKLAALDARLQASHSGLGTFDESAAPAGWKAFVESMGPHM